MQTIKLCHVTILHHAGERGSRGSGRFNYPCTLCGGYMSACATPAQTWAADSKSTTTLLIIGFELSGFLVFVSYVATE